MCAAGGCEQGEITVEKTMCRGVYRVRSVGEGKEGGGKDYEPWKIDDPLQKGF